MADALPDELLTMIFDHAADYAPAIKAVCYRWSLHHFRDGRCADVLDLALRGHIGLLRWIQDCGGAFEVGECDELLMAAAEGGYVDLMRELWEWGAGASDAALVCAAKKGNSEAMCLAFGWGVSVNAVNDALRAAASNDNIDQVVLAVKMGATDFEGAFVLACFRCRGRSQPYRAVKEYLQQQMRARDSRNSTAMGEISAGEGE